MAASLRFWWRASVTIVHGAAWFRLTVMRSVFVGGEGVISGGKSERSRDSGVLVEPRLLDIVEPGGVCLSSAGSAGGVELMIAVVIC
jgi:hypothetical protein